MGAAPRPYVERPAVLLGVVLVMAAAGAAAGALGQDAASAFSIAMAAGIAMTGLLLLPAVEPAVPISAGLALSVFSGNWESLGLPLGLDRPLILYGILGCLLRLRPGREDSVRLEVRPIHWLLLAVSVYAVGSAVFAGTLLSSEPLFALSERLSIVGFLLFAVAPIAFQDPRNRDLLLAVLVGLGGYLGLTALMESTPLDAFVLPRYIDDPFVGITYGRARGPFVESGANGFALYLCGVAAAMGFVRWRDRRGARNACAVVMGLCALGIVLTLTRQAWLGAALGTIVTMLAIRQLRALVVPATAVAAVGVLATLALVPGLNEDVTQRAGDKLSVWDRLSSNDAALNMIEERPLLGFGWYRFTTDSLPYYVQAEDYPIRPVRRAHNLFLSNAAELGLIGAGALVLALLLALGVGILQRPPPGFAIWHAGLLAVAIDWIVIANLSPFGYPLANQAIWLLAGIMWIPRLARQ